MRDYDDGPQIDDNESPFGAAEGDEVEVTWGKLPNGDWGLSVPPSVKEGDTVIAVKRDGARTRRGVGRTVADRGSYRLVERAKAAPKRAAAAPEGSEVEAKPKRAAKKSIDPSLLVSSAEAAAATIKVFAGLDDSQKRIALWKPHMGNVRVLAAAGSGKTRTTVALVAKLVNEGVIAPNRIVVTTFTKKAGLELNKRLAPLLPPEALEGDRAMRVGTFHSIAGKALRAAGLTKRIPFGRNIDVYPAPIRSRNLWRQIIKEVWRSESEQGYVFGTDKRSLEVEGEDIDPKAYQLAVDVARGSPGDEDAVAARLESIDQDDAFPQIVEAWRIFCAAKRNSNLWDFADTLTFYEEGLRAGSIRDSADLVIVDEAQDNNEIQFAIAQHLARAGGNVLLVGDVRQSIYGWRGAEPEIMITADRTINATTMEIPTNYRSGRKIVALGNAICAGEPWAIGSPAQARDGAPPGVVTVYGAADSIAEAAYVAQEIAIGVNGAHGDHGKFAILTRTNAQGGTMEAALVERKIPCVVVGGTPFFQRNEAQGMIAWMKLLLGLDVTALEIHKAFGYPASGLGDATAKKLAERLAAGEPLQAAVEMLSAGVKGKFREKIETFAMGVAVVAAEAEHGEDRWRSTLDALSGMVARGDTTRASAEDDDDKATPGQTTLAIAKSFPEAGAFFAFAERCAGEVAEAEQEVGADGKRIADSYVIPPGRVVISTIHKAKGLEWPVVFVSATSRKFPHVRSSNIAEEQRLFYVAVTRAEAKCSLTYADMGDDGKPGGPSPFLRYASGIAE